MTERDAFVSTLTEALPPSWPLPHGAARRLLERWVDKALERCDDELFGRRFAAACPVPGLPPTAWQHRLLHAPGQPTLLAGIRFKGGSLDFPFVELLAWSRPASRDTWQRIDQRLQAAFAPFQPQAIRVRWPGAGKPPLGPTDSLEVDLRLLAARLSELQRQPRPWGEVSVDLREARSVDWFDQYEAAHAAWRAQAGALGAEVFPQVRSDFEMCLETGAVICAYESDRWAGVTAACRLRGMALDGYCLYEVFLDQRMRGRRRAAALERRLFDRLPDTGRDVVHATVHRLNTPSLRTAQRCGLGVVATHWFRRLP